MNVNKLKNMTLATLGVACVCLNVTLYKTEKDLIRLEDKVSSITNNFYTETKELRTLIEDYKFENESLDYQNRILISEVNELNEYKRNIEKEIAESEVFVDTKNGIVNVDNYSELDLTSKANLSIDEINYVLKDTPIKGLGYAFVEAEKKYDVNSAFLLSLAILESGWGSSNISLNKNNLFGFTAYDDTPSISATYFDSYEDSIYATAKHLKEAYLSEDGKYFRGYTIKDVNTYYCTSKTWSNKLYDVLHTVSKRVKLYRGE